MPEAAVEDSEARHLAASALDRNIVVEAGAGTGKTSLLVERALMTIVAAGLPIQRLVAITFTEKAASELRERLASGVEDLLALCGGEGRGVAADAEAHRAWARLNASGPAGAGMPQGAIRAACLEALENFEEGFVGTIHSFAAGMLRRHPRESGVDPGFEVDDGSRQARLFDEAWAAFLAAELGPRSGRAALWERALARFGLEDLERAARALARFDLPLDRAAPGKGVAEAACALLRERAAGVRRELEEIPPASLAGKSREWLEGALPLLGALERGDFVSARREWARAAGGWRETRPSAPAGFAGGLGAEEADARMSRARRFLAQAAQADPQAGELLLELLAPLARSVRAGCLEAGFLSYEALLALARDLLRGSPAVLREEQRRAGVLMVDELQDTDPLQYEIVLMLARAQGEAAGDPYGSRLEAGKLFLVGDPKQSIYRFRGADIAACQRAVEAVLREGGVRVVLRTNFRSVPAIVGPVNVLFSEAFGKQAPPVQPLYEPIAPHRPDIPGGGVTVMSVAGSPGDRTGRLRLAEARAIAAEMRRHREAGGPGEAGGGEARDRPKWSDMALLLPAMTVGSIYARGLREQAIPFVMEGGRSYREKSEITLALALLGAVANPSDPVAFLAVARSPLGAATDAELARWAAGGGRFPPRGDEVAGGEFPGIARALGLLESLRARARGVPVDELVRMALERTPLAALCAVAWEGAQRVANLRTLAARAAVIARRDGLSLEATIEALRADLEASAEGESPLADERLDAVRVMTWHAAKGLEFPLVFVADLLRDARQSRRRLREEATAAWWEDGAGAGGWALCLPSERGRLLTPAEALRREREGEFEDAEDIRGFYVACTRARDRLVLVQSDPKGRGTWSAPLKAWGYDPWRGPGAPAFPVSRRLPVAGVRHETAPAAGAGPSSEDSGSAPDFGPAVERFERAVEMAGEAGGEWIVTASGGVREPARRSRPTGAASGGGAREAPDIPPRPAKETEAEVAGLASDERDLPSGVERDLAAAAGTVVHALLESWDRRDASWFREAVPRFSEVEARRRGLDPRAIRAEADRVLEGFLASDLPARLASLDLVGRELPVLHPRGEILVAGVADLLYRQPDGTVVVADYKTDPTPVEGAASLIGRYRHQLEAYLEALEAVRPAGGRARAELWLIRSGKIVPFP